MHIDGMKRWSSLSALYHQKASEKGLHFPERSIHRSLLLLSERYGVVQRRQGDTIAVSLQSLRPSMAFLRFCSS